jgi:hypothetical protein
MESKGQYERVEERKGEESKGAEWKVKESMRE